MACKHGNLVCNICVYFGDVRQFSSSQKYVQKQSLTECYVTRCATKRVLLNVMFANTLTAISIKLFQSLRKPIEFIFQ